MKPSTSEYVLGCFQPKRSCLVRALGVPPSGAEPQGAGGSGLVVTFKRIECLSKESR